MSATRESSDGSSVPEKHSLRQSLEVYPPELGQEPDPEPTYSGSAAASSSNSPSPRPPPFSSLYFPPAPEPSKVIVTEPDPSCVPSLAPSVPLDSPFVLSAAEAEVKAALPRDTKGETLGRSADEAEPPPPYTEGSSPLEGFTYTMAAAGGAASIITQVQQGGPAPVNTLGGMCSNLSL